MQGRQNTRWVSTSGVARPPPRAAAKRRRHALVGRPEDRDDLHPERRRQVHRARVVRDERRASRDDAGELTEVGAPDQVHHSNVGRQRRFYLTAGVAIAGGTEHDAHRARLAREPDDRLGDEARRPALRVPVRGAGREPDDAGARRDVVRRQQGVGPRQRRGRAPMRGHGSPSAKPSPLTSSR